MRARIRALERKLAKQIAQIKVEPIVEEIVDQWPDRDNPEDKDKPAPDSLDLLDKLNAARIFLPTVTHAIGYLDQCWYDRIMPRKKHILNRLLPWLSRTPMPYGYAAWQGNTT